MASTPGSIESSLLQAPPSRRVRAMGNLHSEPIRFLADDVQRAAVADAIDLGLIHRVLVIKLRHHGDVLLTSPVFSALKRLGPHLELDALVYRETAEMLEGHPAIRRIHTIDRDLNRAGGVRRVSSELGLWRDLRA